LHDRKRLKSFSSYRGLLMVLLESVAAPPILLLHVAFFVLGTIVWFAGSLMVFTAFKENRLQEMAPKINRVLFLGGLLLAVGFVAGSLLYPAMRAQVIGGALGFHVTQPFYSLLFLIKQWVAAIGALAVVGSITFNSGTSKRHALATLFLCILVLVTIVVDVILAVIITTASAL
jgi:hypothetical protein